MINIKNIKLIKEHEFKNFDFLNKYHIKPTFEILPYIPTEEMDLATYKEENHSDLYLPKAKYLTKIELISDQQIKSHEFFEAFGLIMSEAIPFKKTSNDGKKTNMKAMYTLKFVHVYYLVSGFESDDELYFEVKK